MARVIVKKPINTEKSFAEQDNKGIYTFLVNSDANKIEIKQSIEELFDVTVDTVNTTSVRKKVRKIGRSKIHTKRQAGKIARITLKKDSKKLDLTKTKK